VSSADLLDILSNGNEPVKVMKHLTKLFDSMARLKLREKVEKTACGMFAKDGEDLDFPRDCDLGGQVEVWLNRLLEMQCETVHYWLTDSVTAYEVRSREQWILDFPGTDRALNLFCDIGVFSDAFEARIERVRLVF
jgi:dynein heavy chain